jgi:hypothetical protein
VANFDHRNMNHRSSSGTTIVMLPLRRDLRQGRAPAIARLRSHRIAGMVACCRRASDFRAPYWELS